MKVTTSRDENGKRIRVRAYRGRSYYPHTDGSARHFGPPKYMPHQGKREKARRLLPQTVELEGGAREIGRLDRSGI